MSQFAPEDHQGDVDFVSDGNITFESDRNQDGAGDIVFRTGGVERSRIKANGSGTGWANVLGGSISALAPGNLKLASPDGTIIRYLPSAPIRRLQSLFAPLVCDLAVGLRPNGVDYELLSGFGSARYARWLIEYQTGNPGALPLHQLSRVAEVVPMLSVLGSDASVTRGAGVTGPTADAAAYGGQYWHGDLAAQTFTYVTPAGVRAGWRGPRFGNGGGAIVSIDGDKTKANLLPTAQNVVDSGAFPNTILVANGGTANPTDRILDTWGPVTIKDDQVALADNLAAGAHTVVLTPLGVNRSVGGGARVYFSGYGYATSLTSISSANVTTYASVNLNTFGGSAWEYALQSGGTFFASVHGYEGENALTVAVDGAPLTLSAGQLVSAESAIDIARSSYMVNPAATSQTIAAGNVGYHIDRDALRLDRAINWLASVPITAAYLMAPMNGVALGTSGRIAQADVLFNQASMLNYPNGPFTFTGAADTFNGNVKTDALWLMGGNYGALTVVLDVDEWTNSWQRSTNFVAIEDRGTSNPQVTKPYVGRVWSASGRTETPNVGDTWKGSTLHQIGRFPGGAAASLAA